MTMPLKAKGPPHKCPVRGCTAIARGDRIMCGGHWGLVPVVIQRAVWREYRRKPMSTAHLASCDLAVRSVNELIARGL